MLSENNMIFKAFARIVNAWKADALLLSCICHMIYDVNMI